MDIFTSFDTLSIMKGFSLTIVVIIVSIFYLDAFLPSPQPHHSKRRSVGRVTLSDHSPLFRLQGKNSDKDDLPSAFTHGDILWKVRPPPDTPRLKRLWLRFAANVIRLDCLVKRQEPPLVLCPKGRQAVLEAHYRPNNSSKFHKIARFGFTTERGAPAPPIQESVQEIYGLEPSVIVGVAAIIYMFVEPPYRKKQLGTLALQVISLIQSIQNCDFTVLVVDDNGSGMLNDWYEKNGYSKAPKLQNLMGSPNAVNGITMITPTRRILPYDCHIQWW
jgi:hypothetical protein